MTSHKKELSDITLKESMWHHLNRKWNDITSKMNWMTSPHKQAWRHHLKWHHLNSTLNDITYTEEQWDQANCKLMTSPWQQTTRYHPNSKLNDITTSPQQLPERHHLNSKLNKANKTAIWHHLKSYPNDITLTAHHFKSRRSDITYTAN